MITAPPPLELAGRGTPRALRCRVLQSPLAGAVSYTHLTLPTTPYV